MQRTALPRRQAAAAPARWQRRRRAALAPRCTAASCSRALPLVTTQTIVTLSGPEDLQRVLQGNDLVAETFYAPAPHNALADAVAFNAYRLRSAAQTMGLHMGPGRGHATIVALAGEEGQLEAEGEQRQQQQQQQRRRQQGAEQRAVGVVNVTLMAASSTIAAAAGVARGTPFAMITNMAVAPPLRRRGVSHLLMRAAIRAALVELDASPQLALLLAYKYFEPAMRLYEAWGFEQTEWEDPLWREDAEKGRTGRQRRVMLTKQLSGPGLLAHPLPGADGRGDGGSGRGAVGAERWPA
ncbi:hypothetical protein HT031_006296 [Scenedesmus sp. PABB004]|nr:hypothetical protein HT031_006296 [Scenedesmus sp. PABB004]